MNIKKQILETISQDFNTKVEDILSDSRKSEVVDARCVLASVFYFLGFSASETGRYLNRDHTSILSLLKRTKKKEVLKSLAVSYYDIFKFKLNGKR